MGFFDKIFDFNRDGKLSGAERLIGLKIMEDCMREDFDTYSHDDYETDDDWREYCESGEKYDLDPEDFDSEEEYEDALAEAKEEWLDAYEEGWRYDLEPEDFDSIEEYKDAIEHEKYAWRYECEDGEEYNLDPEDFDSQEEYEDALEEAKEEWKYDCEDGWEYDLDPEDFDSQEEYEEALEKAKKYDKCDEYEEHMDLDYIFINPGDYPNKRQFEAAYYLEELERDLTEIPEGSTKEAEKEKCRFILSANTIAGQYLTILHGFLYIRAVKENFTLPFEIPNEEDEPSTVFDDLLQKAAKENPQQALKIWTWCIEEFVPFKKYATNISFLYMPLVFIEAYPKEFMDLLVSELCTNANLRRELLTENPEFPYYDGRFVFKAMQQGFNEEAAEIFTAITRNPTANKENMEWLIDSILDECCDFKSRKGITQFQTHILPLIQKSEYSYIQQLLPQIKEYIASYLFTIKPDIEKHEQSQKYQQEEQSTLHYNIKNNPSDEPPKKEEHPDQEQPQETPKYKTEIHTSDQNTTTPQKTQNESRSKNHQGNKKDEIPSVTRKQEEDPLAAADKTIYHFCSVIFSSAKQSYAYRTDNINVKIGDTVLVPVGKNNRELKATVVSTSQSLSFAAPYPINKTKKVIAVIEEENDDNNEWNNEL